MSNRKPFSLAVLCASVIALTACGDSPSTSAVSEPVSKGPRLTRATSSVTLATLDPTEDNVYVSVEGHRIFIPAYSVCAIGSSGYGADVWDKPCAPQKAPVVFVIKSTVDRRGQPRVDLSPDVRFSPSKVVTATFKSYAAANASNPAILYCPTGSNKCIDEARTDPSLVTMRDATTGLVSRRIKHFSGYNVILGVVGCDDPDTCPVDPAAASASLGVPSLGSLAQASGYITTTGRSFSEPTRTHSSDEANY